MSHRASRVPRRDDAGLSLAEVLVAMALFSMLLALVMSVVVGMTRETITASSSSDNALGVRRAYTLLDQQVRSAEAVNPATAVDGRWYLEMQLAPATLGGPSTCVQWRLGTDGVLAFRTFPTSGTPGAGDWREVTRDVVVPPAGAPAPLRSEPADTVYARQRVVVELTVRRGATRPAQLDVTLVARNTSSSTVTNDPTAAQVCTQGGRP